MADDHGGYPNLASAVEGQLVDHRGHDGVETGCWLVAEEEFGIQREGTGKADAFPHSSTELGGFKIFEAGEADELQLHFHDHLDEGGIDLAVFLKRQSNILADGHRLKKGTELKVHSKA